MVVLSMSLGRLARSALLIAGVAVAAGFDVSPAAAGPEPCSVTYVTAEGSNALQCQNGTGNNDFLNPLAVNAQNFFGHNDWTFLEREPGNDGGTDQGFGYTTNPPNNNAGTWWVNAGALSAYDEFMIVLKAGTQWAGFLFDNEDADNGTWSFPGSPGLSHLSLYVRGESPEELLLQVPEPATLALAAFTFAGLGFARRRRRI
jgi:hypothetical protein